MIFALCRRLVPLVTAFLIGQAGAATFTVTSTADTSDPNDGVITLREAVAQANAHSSGASTIEFQLGDGAHVITLDAALTLSKPVHIKGPGRETLTLALSPREHTQTAMNLTIFLPGCCTQPTGPERMLWIDFEATDVSLSGLRLVGAGNQSLLYARSNTDISASEVSGFGRVVNIEATDIDVNFRTTSFIDNDIILLESGVSGNPYIAGSQLTIDSSLLQDNGAIFNAYKTANTALPFALTLTGSRVTSHQSQLLFDLHGDIVLNIDGTTIDNNELGTLLEAQPGISARGPVIDIVNSTISGNSWQPSAPFIGINEGASLAIRHSTLTGNASELTSIPLVGPYGPGGQIQIDHSVITENAGSRLDIVGLNDHFLTASSAAFLSYSLVDDYGLGVSLEAPVAGPALLQPLTFHSTLRGYHLPDPASPLLGAGSPGLQAGSGSTPEKDQRGSDRIIGGVIDIGAVEFNREPDVDLAALKQAFREETGEALNIRRVSTDGEIFYAFLDIILDPGIIIDGGGSSSWGGSTIIGLSPGGLDQPIMGLMTVSAATAASELIYVDLDNVITDPDGDIIDRVGLSLQAGEVFELDIATRQLSGTRENFLNHPVALALRDEHGLVGTHAFQILPATAEDSGSGGAGFGLLLLVGLGWLRRRR